MRAILMMAALFAAAIGAFLFYQQRLAASQEEEEIVYTDRAPGTVAQPLDTGPIVPKHLQWKLDPRWTRSETEGMPVVQEIRALYEWQENEGGDPIHFRREKERLLNLLQPHVEELLELQGELAHHPGAAGVVELRIREFSGAMAGVLR